MKNLVFSTDNNYHTFILSYFIFLLYIPSETVAEIVTADWKFIKFIIYWIDYQTLWHYGSTHGSALTGKPINRKIVWVA